MSKKNVNFHTGISTFLNGISDNRLFVIFFILLVLKVLPGPNGNRMMGGIVWLIAGFLLIGWFYKCYGLPLKWVGLAIKWINTNKLTAFFWILLTGALFISCLCAILSIQEYAYTELNHWIVTDEKPLGASIKAVYDDQLQMNVMEFSGAGEDDEFKMFNPLYRKRSYSEALVLKWRMKFDSYYSVRIKVETREGRRTLLYTPDEKGALVTKKKSKTVHHGLGEDTAKGKWKLIVRDLNNDLQEGYPGLQVRKVIYFRIIGNGRFDDRNLMEAFGWVWKSQQLPLALLISALGSYTFLFLTYRLFCLSHDDKGYWWVLVLMILVNVIPFWQKFNLDAIGFLIKYTVADDVLNRQEIPSVLRAVTTYSPFAAVLSVFFWGRFLLKKSTGMYRHAELLVGVLAMGGSLLAGSRTGILALFMGFLTLVCYVPGHKRWWLPCLALVAIVGVHVFALLNPYLGKKMGMVFPYINKLRHHEIVTPSDFVPNLSAGYSDKKVNRWVRIKESFALWRKNPWFGVGLGQYNILSGHKWIGNVHNLFLNILCEAGIFVFLSWIYLSARFVWRRRHSFLVAVIVSIFVVSIFENLFDHSMPWALTCAWIFSSEESPVL
ncbi:MAG: O-antigen ligase family protein [Deltaproteobacteria bacterium]|nr:O-antigen ligase family protein [Deltaproteobacteria bacterium]